MFAEVIEYRNGGEFIVEVDTDQLPWVFHFLVSSVHAELVGLHSLVVEVGQYIVISHHLNEIVLTPLVVITIVIIIIIVIVIVISNVVDIVIEEVG